jgi:gluconolactonase
MEIEHLKTIGSGIYRPEGVMALDDGSLCTADARGTIDRVAADGTITFWGELGGVPNGICFDAKGSCIVANIGNGQVQRLSPDGSHEVLLTEIDGRCMRAPNFPYVDEKGGIWVSNSTENENIDAVLVNPVPDGCVALIKNGKAKIVADGIYFANGITLDKKEEYLYVAQTTRSNVLRYRIKADGSCGPAETYGPSPLAENGFPDGVAFDEAGNLWVTFPRLNAVGYITPAGALEMVLYDPGRRVLQRPSNICFGGPDRKTAFIGSLDGNTIPYFEVEHPGMRLVHQKK